MKTTVTSLSSEVEKSRGYIARAEGAAPGAAHRERQLRRRRSVQGDLMPDSNRVMADAEALLQRVSPEGRRLAQRQRQRRNRAMDQGGRPLAGRDLRDHPRRDRDRLGRPDRPDRLPRRFGRGARRWVILFAMSHEPGGDHPDARRERHTPCCRKRPKPGSSASARPCPRPAQRLADGIGLKLEQLAPQVAHSRSARAGRRRSAQIAERRIARADRRLYPRAAQPAPGRGQRHRPRQAAGRGRWAWSTASSPA